MYKLIRSCGCVQVIDVTTWVDVIDSVLLPQTDINIVGLIIDGTLYEFNETFDSREDIISYLNGTFVHTEELDIIFRLDGNLLQFESPDFSTIEIMAIYQPYLRVFKVGNPIEDINIELTAEFANGETIVDDSLSDEVLGVHVGNGPVMPFTTQGYTHTPEDLSLAFGSDLVVEDSYVFVLTKQVPA